MIFWEVRPLKLRLYFDTSVFSAYYDARVPDRQQQTQEFWKRLDKFEISTSEIARQELSKTSDPEQRLKLYQLLQPFIILSVTEEMRLLAQGYLTRGLFTPVMFNDALHVAVAVLSRQDILLSWNFKHLVNRRRRAMINEVSISKGLPTIEIIAPPEV